MTEYLVFWGTMETSSNPLNAAVQARQHQRGGNQLFDIVDPEIHEGWTVNLELGRTRKAVSPMSAERVNALLALNQVGD